MNESSTDTTTDESKRFDAVMRTIVSMETGMKTGATRNVRRFLDEWGLVNAPTVSRLFGFAVPLSTSHALHRSRAESGDQCPTRCRRSFFPEARTHLR